MFRNKHVVIALLVAPVLALIAYFAVDAVVAEKPEKALAGSSYPLVAKSNCRYASGRCSLENGDVQLEIEKTTSGLEISSSHSVTGFRLALASADSNSETYVELKPIEENRRWIAELSEPPPNPGLLRLAVVVAGSTYFVETSLAFTLTNFELTVKGKR
ncbi:MAG: hypothetical protein AB8B48_09235 [Pseudomonadales bacterium]